MISKYQLRIWLIIGIAEQDIECNTAVQLPEVLLRVNTVQGNKVSNVRISLPGFSAIAVPETQKSH